VTDFWLPWNVLPIGPGLPSCGLPPAGGWPPGLLGGGAAWAGASGHGRKGHLHRLHAAELACCLHDCNSATFMPATASLQGG